MLIVISLKNIEKIFFTTKSSYVDFKMGSKVIKCNNRSIFTNCVSFFCSGSITRCFYTVKRAEVIQKAQINMFNTKRIPLEASFYGFYKDKHRKFYAIMTEILPQLG